MAHIVKGIDERRNRREIRLVPLDEKVVQRVVTFAETSADCCQRL